MNKRRAWTTAGRHDGTMATFQRPNQSGQRHGDLPMNRSFAALALGCALTCTSFAVLAGAATPEIGPPPSQTGVDPRVQGNDPQRQGTDMDKGDPATGIRDGMNINSMSNGTGSGNDTDLPGGSSTGSDSKGSSGGSSSAGGAGG
jgi:serine protease autotransporter